MLDTMTVAKRPFPTLGVATGKASTSAVANVSALPQGASVMGAQFAGLIALGLAFILAVTRLSVRRRPIPESDEDADENENEASSVAAETPQK